MQPGLLYQHAIGKVVLAFCIIYSLCLFGCKKNNATPLSLQLDSSQSITTELMAKPNVINALIGGYYIGLPSNYNQSSGNYPLLVYFPGAGQFGNGSIDLPLLLNDGPAELIDEKKFPGTFRVNQKTFSFIVLMPQCKTFPGVADVQACIDFAKHSYRIDTTRIYLSGLSIGSIVACDMAAQMPSAIAALVPMAGVCSAYNASNQCQQIANANLPVWAFHCLDDPTISVTTSREFIAKIAGYHPAISPKLTLWPNGGHDAWTKALNPDYKENGMNIYEWMLQYHR